MRYISVYPANRDTSSAILTTAAGLALEDIDRLFAKGEDMQHALFEGKTETAEIENAEQKDCSGE